MWIERKEILRKFWDFQEAQHCFISLRRLDDVEFLCRGCKRVVVYNILPTVSFISYFVFYSSLVSGPGNATEHFGQWWCFYRLWCPLVAGHWHWQNYSLIILATRGRQSILWWQSELFPCRLSNYIIFIFVPRESHSEIYSLHKQASRPYNN